MNLLVSETYSKAAFISCLLLSAYDPPLNWRG